MLIKCGKQRDREKETERWMLYVYYVHRDMCRKCGFLLLLVVYGQVSVCALSAYCIVRVKVYCV